MKIKSFLLILFALGWTEAGKILGVFPFGGISHYILASKLMKGLVEAGHEVTMISPYKLKDQPKNGKYTDIILDGFEEDFNKMMSVFNLFGLDNQNPIKQMQLMMEIMVDGSNKTLHHPNVKKLLQSNAKFDVVIMEQFVNDALKVFAHHYGCPLIILSATGPNPWINDMVGNPQPVAYVPNIQVRDFSPDSIWDRAKNAFFYLMDYFLTNYFVMPKFEEIMHQAFPNAPSLYDLRTNVSLILLNSHTSLFDAVPIVPNMVEIGGYFIDPPKALPKDLQEFLDNAKDGAIYFSMGSNLKSKDVPKEKREAILKVLGKLKQKVLWKFEEDLPGKPPNVMIKKWLPQQDVLAHPNIKLFITHGGMLSTTETIYHGVPFLAIPVFADQPANAARAVTGGYGLKLEYNDPSFSEEKLGSLINELLNNPKYRENVQRRSKIFHDRPQKPMETAAYWVEYVIKHKGAPHLRVAGVRMPWYQYFMVDVIAVIILTLALVIYSLKFICRALVCKKSRGSDKKFKKS